MAEEQMQNLSFSPEDLAGQERRNRRKDQAAAFASWLNSMSIRPDPDLPAQFQAARAARVEDLRKNRTVNMLEQAGQTELANLVKAGTLDAKSAASQMFQLAAEERQFARQKELIDYKVGLGVGSAKPNIQSKGVYRDKSGKIIGEVNFDTSTGDYFQHDSTTGKRLILDMRELTPVTDATFAKTIPSRKEFGDLADELGSDIASMRKLESYMRSIKNSNVGFKRLADDLAANAKTLLTGYIGEDYESLTPEQLNLRIGRGLLQGLIGRFRIETVGGGVMTEQDALRIIQNLGGDVNLLQNKEVVAKQIENLFRDKENSFNRKKKQYDIALNQIYRSQGFGDISDYKFDKEVFNLKGKVETETPTMSDQELLSSVANKSGQELSDYLKTLSQADLNRLLELQE